MKKRMMTWAVAFLSLAVLVLVSYPLAGTLAQGQGGGKGQGNNGGKPGGEESTTNLSYPAYFYGTSLQSGDIGTFNLNGEMSYGCALPETIGTTTYPNTSCVNDDGSPQTLSGCEARCVLNNEPVQVDRIYWQKDSKNKWQAGYSLSADEVGDPKSLSVEYVDWGDNLESKSWPVQVIRVETNTFSTLPELNPDGVNPRVRFDMWHVFGQGTNELWGVHTTNPQPDPETGIEPSPVPYVYLDGNDAINWPYAVNVTPTVRLNIAKLPASATACPTTANNKDWSPFQGSSNLVWFFDQTTQTGHWVNAPYTNDILYGAELNIKGSYVYGYNWNLGTEPVPETPGKTGWWRLTFYTPDGSIDFSKFVNPTATGDNALAPPPDQLFTTGLISSPLASISAEEGESGAMLYVPQVLYDANPDHPANLTYIDICITGSSGGGGGSGKGGGGSHKGGVGGGHN